MARYVIFILAGGALWGIAMLALTPLSIAGDRQLLMRGISVGLFAVWLAFGWLLGIWLDLWSRLTGASATVDASAMAVEQRHDLKSPDFAAAERLHGPLPADIEALYRSDLRLDSGVELRRDGEIEVLIETFLPIHRPYANPLFPALADGDWISLAEDGFGNVYAARPAEAVDGATPLYLFDHETAAVPLALGCSVRDLLDGASKIG